MTFFWDPQETPAELHSVLRTLAEEYPVREAGAQSNVSFKALEGCEERLKVSRSSDGKWLVEYSRPTLAARGLAHVLAGLECDESPFFTTFGILLDCTRGNVITVPRFKGWLRRLAMMGYNTAMIYIKDAYQLPGEPYFGYMRGAYSIEEMREVDSYAQSLGIEMIGSIQALGHVEPVLRWETYAPVKDTADVMLVDEPATYELLKKILTFWSQAFSSRRIHLGMDETQTLGRGKFLDKHGYENPFYIYNRHLKKLCQFCDELGLRPTIWADMYFSYLNKEMGYKDFEEPLPEAIQKEIPGTLQFSYWNYYTRNAETYADMLKASRKLNGVPPLMASGVWTWYRNWTDYEYTFATVRACVEGCRRSSTTELIFTMWGDDGGYCEFNSAQAGLVWAADLGCKGIEDEEVTAKLFEVICKSSYKRHLACGDLTYTGFDEEGKVIDKVSSCSMLWDDPIMGIVWNELAGTKLKDPIDNMLSNYLRVLEAAEDHREDHNAGDFNYAWCLADLLIRKIRVRQKLLHGYREREWEVLEDIAECDIPDILDAIEGFAEAYRTQWLRSFKPYGLELMQIRLGGLSERYRELARRIDELLDGKVDTIPELEEKMTNPLGRVPYQYFRCATGNFFI